MMRINAFLKRIINRPTLLGASHSWSARSFSQTNGRKQSLACQTWRQQANSELSLTLPAMNPFQCHPTHYRHLMNIK